MGWGWIRVYFRGPARALRRDQSAAPARYALSGTVGAIPL